MLLKMNDVRMYFQIGSFGRKKIFRAVDGISAYVERGKC